MALPRAFLQLLLLCAISLTLPWHASGQVDSVRVVGDGVVTRVTLWSDGPLQTDVLVAREENARQVLVAFDGASAATQGPMRPVSHATGISGYGWQDGFLAFNLTHPMMVSRKLDLPPAGDERRYRIVIDLAAVSDARFQHAASRVERRVADRLAAHRSVVDMQVATVNAAPEGREVVLEPAPKPNEYLVVIDPGHGGKDPGAISSAGLKEKDVVLSASLALKDILEETGRYRVRMTRADDRFIELGDRVSLAREWGADLFISIHADAARSPDVAGASVYTISERGEGRIDRESERNNWDIDVEEGVSDEVSGILETLTIRETKSNSGLFAELLLPELAKAGPVLRNTHRKAGFYVLLAPDVPAVLLEMGFLTNTADARRLEDARGRRASMEAVAEAIDTYFDRQDLVFASN
ncbi:MAG: N-acetylmuramoyl-L-alanine amidase [Pseudomonadota bacterium]